MRKAAEPVNLVNTSEHTDKCSHGPNTSILSAFEKWLTEYRDRLATLLQENTNATGGH
jgi:hypothetical protein